MHNETAEGFPRQNKIHIHTTERSATGFQTCLTTRYHDFTLYANKRLQQDNKLLEWTTTLISALHHTEETHHRHARQLNKQTNKRLKPNFSQQTQDTTTKAYITIAIQLRYDYDTTIPRRIRLQQKWSKLWFPLFDCDTTMTKNWHVHWLLASNARVIHRSHLVVGL